MNGLATRVGALLFVLVAGALCVNATEGGPSAKSVLFEADHLGQVAAGSQLSYRLDHKVSDEKLLGLPFSDEIKIAIERVADDGKRDVKVSVFTGDRARPTQPIAGLTGNPLLVIFLDRSVRNYAMIAGGRTAYLKNRFKVELAKNSTVTPTKVPYNGGEVDGYRVSVTPFVHDPNRHKMRGYEGSTYEFVVSENVPGYFVELVAVLESPKEGAPRLEERVMFDGVGSGK